MSDFLKTEEKKGSEKWSIGKAVFMIFALILAVILIPFLLAFLAWLAPFAAVSFIGYQFFVYLSDRTEIKTKLKANKTYCKFLLLKNGVNNNSKLC